MNQKENAPLIDHLYRLASGNDRAVLAELRRSLREGRNLDALPVVLPFLGEKSRNRWAEDDAALVAGLFALHPVAGSVSLASALSRAKRETGSESIEARFRALMGASREDLAVHLRHAVGLLAGLEIGFDWDDLYKAIRHWSHGGSSKRQWARDFWAPAANQQKSETPHEGTHEAQEST